MNYRFFSTFDIQVRVDTEVNKAQADFGWFGKKKKVSKNPEKTFAVRQQEVVPRINSEMLNQFYYSSLATGKHTAEYGDDVNATSFDKSTPWGLCELPDRLLNRKLGITSPYTYFAFGGSSFVLHTEDQYLCSVSRLIRGAKKAWFVMPPEFAG